MTTMCIADASAELQARIEEAKKKRAALGITPIEYRPAIVPTEYCPVFFHPDIPAGDVQDMLNKAGYSVVYKRGRMEVRK